METVPVIRWSVWERSATVRWAWDGRDVELRFQRSPLSVIPLRHAQLIAVALDPAETASENLRLFHFTGEFYRSYGAPVLGTESHFGELQEAGAGLKATVGYMEDGRWAEKKGTFDLASGEMCAFHPSR